MDTIQELTKYLEKEHADFEMIAQDQPILSVEDAKQYYDIKKAAPVFILESDQGLIACIMSANRGRMDFNAMKHKFGYSKLNMADRKNIKKLTGFDAGKVPLVGLNLAVIFDDALLQYDYIYGGTGDELVTLKINPADVKRLNKIIGIY